ncbi:MAG: endolytic transglycosylase MltG [Rhodospirillaceae bacterium]|nr:endolytic transglycosylase MltG [Rhodospirillaceae bacterium]
MRDRLLTAFLSLIALALAIVIGAYLWSLNAINAPGPLKQPATLIIKPGSGLGAIARQLDEAGVVVNNYLFEWEARRTGQAGNLKPGEYKFEPAGSISAVLDKLVKRDVVARFVTIPEGLVTADIIKILGAAEGLMGDTDATVPDGALLPETYRYEWGDTKTAVIERMRKARETALADLWAKRAPDLPLDSPEQAMVLASIVEKETGVAAERPKVAGVFINRLKKKMKLQSDPTVIYGINPLGLDRELTRADLAAATPYNTYVVDGLPPSPIAHPGLQSIAAVLNPEATDALYFVADGTGGHAFADTLAEHNKNVARWRKLNAQAPAAAPEAKPAPAKAPAKTAPAKPKAK